MQIAPTRLIGAMLVVGSSLCTYAPAQAVVAGVPEKETPREPEPAESDEKPSTRKQEVKTIEVKSQRLSTTDERRESAAAKIIFGRDEIEKYGDAALVDVLRRLPGVTVSSGGAVSLRGMGAGYTQILIDGERVASGFSIEQLSPEQVERIEILRAPTAETGARAIAGTINIILRKPRRKKEDDFKLSTQRSHGKFGEDASISRNDAMGLNGTYNLTLTVRGNDSELPNDSRIVSVNTLTGQTDLDRRFISTARSHSSGATLGSQFQWKWKGDEQLTLQPFLSMGTYGFNSSDRLLQPVGANPPYASGSPVTAVKFNNARLIATVSRHLDDATRIEIRSGGGRVKRHLDTSELQFDNTGASVLTQTMHTESQDTSGNLSIKLIHTFSDTGKFTGGAEVEQVRRVDHTRVVLNGTPQLADFGTELDVSTLRRAAYLQMEWDPAKNWSANVGARWEGFEARSNTDSGGFNAVKNRSSILTPLAHLAWRFDAPKKDLLRLSLTQSYQTPSIFSLIPRPRLDATYPVPGPNTPSFPDFAGNADLKPERANGLDLAYEHYFPDGGIASINFFSRRIHDVLSNVISLENVSWASSPRYVQRPRNVGNAVSSGIEFDTKFKLTEMLDGALPVEFRANLSLFDSKVDGVPGPNNRLPGQPHAKGNLGADYRFTSIPVSVGATISYTPASTVQVSDTQQTIGGANRVIDAYALWTLSPGSKLRLTISNLLPRAESTLSLVQAGNERQSTFFAGSSYPTISLRWEVRL